MKSFLRRLLKYVAYLSAAVVILLAVAVGLFRLLLPRLPEYQEEIKDWANAAIGLEVEFSGMDARWRFSGPELNFYDASLSVPGEGDGEFAAEEVSVGVGLMRLLMDRKLVVDRIAVRDASVSVRRGDDGAWRVQGMRLDALTERFTAAPGGQGLAVVAEDVAVDFEHPQGGPEVSFDIDSMRLSSSGSLMEAEASLALPDEFGTRLALTAGRRDGNDGTAWQLTVEGRGLRLAAWSALEPDALPGIDAGVGDLSLALAWRDGRVTNATADFDFDGVDGATLDLPLQANGRVDFERDDAGWLVAVENLRVRSAASAWPATNLRVEGGLDDDGALESFSASASYLNLGDLGIVLPWLPESWRATARRYGAIGVLREVSVDVDELTSDEPRYDVSMRFEDAGLLAGERLPGGRGFTGSLRANSFGGRLEVDATGLEVDPARWLDEPVPLERARGTVIWRRSREALIVLSDSILLENADFSTASSLQLSLPADDSSPVLDLESRFTVSDIGRARRYLPEPVIKPSLYRWLNGALVAGEVTEGTARVSGPLERFPYHNGEGVFRVEATLADATLRYSDLWPDVQNLDLDVIVDRTRLYSNENTSINAGNSVVDAEIEIEDLREPVLTIDAFATGTMESIRQFARRSPVSRVFGSHLDRVSVTGDASFDLELRYPIGNRDAYEFTTRIRPGGATLEIDGFEPPITAVNGVVEVTRDDIGTESLTGRFLGEPVTIDLAPAGDALPAYSVVASVAGTASATGVANGFGLPVTRVLDGATEYTAKLKFPRPGVEEPAPFMIELDSAMTGIGVALPAPVGKPADEARPLSTTIEFPSGTAIDAGGSFGDELKWTLGFLKSGQGWDFDRGTLAAGGAYPGTAETRGLHIAGRADEVRLREWLALASDDAAGGTRLADRVRSIDLDVGNLYVLGQHFGEHRVVVERSANDWAVRVDGVEARGNVTIPYDFDSGRPLVLDMERLILPGSDEDAPQTEFTTDPRTLPPLSIRAGEFALGSRQLGRIEADFERTPDGLRAPGIRTEDESFTIEGTAGWEVDTSEPTGQRTFVTATLKSSDVDATMQRLNSRPGIDGEDLEIRFDVSWSGGPREDFLSSLDGSFEVRFGTGQLAEVEPGAGRMFGLMSIVALPRRLSLDFRDVLDEGFVFDEITGTFRVDDGSAYTCDLSLEGPAADIGIVGRASLVEQDYQQSAVVSSNVGNTLPVVGAVVGGPQVAAALLIFSQIFKKPLQEMGQIYYMIEGSWDDPRVESVNPRRFAETSEMAGCIGEQG